MYAVKILSRYVVSQLYIVWTHRQCLFIYVGKPYYRGLCSMSPRLGLNLVSRSRSGQSIPSVELSECDPLTDPPLTREATYENWSRVEGRWQCQYYKLQAHTRVIFVLFLTATIYRFTCTSTFECWAIAAMATATNDFATRIKFLGVGLGAVKTLGCRMAGFIRCEPAFKCCLLSSVSSRI